MLALQIPTAKVFRPLIGPRRYKAAHGGRGSGKSHFFGGLLISRCYAEGIRAVCVREVQNTLRDSVRQLLIDKIQAFGLGKFFDITDTEIRGANGSLIIFRGMRDYNAESIKSLERYNVAWVEEAQSLSERSLGLLRPTIREPGSEIWFSWNPENEDDPVDKFFRGPVVPDDAIVVQANWSDNPWFNATLRKEMKHDRATDPEKAAHVWDGGYNLLTEGSYYAKLLVDAERAGRICDLAYDPSLPVHTFWDLGIDDYMAIWFGQATAGQWRWLDYYENTGKALGHYANICAEKAREHEFVYGSDVWPHDGVTRVDGKGENPERRCDIWKSLTGRDPIIIKNHNVGDGIEATRTMIGVSWYDRRRCASGVKHLRHYGRDYDPDRKVFRPEPRHDEHSHGADAHRTAGMGRSQVSNDVWQGNYTINMPTGYIA